jgi:collagen triple helix repeat protein
VRTRDNLLLTALIAVVCGFLGALGGIAVLNDELVGPQGPTGLQGLPGEEGPPGADGSDGVDGVDGERGPRGRSGQAAEEQPVDLGTEGCAGTSVRVVTDVSSDGEKIQVERETVCVTG